LLPGEPKPMAAAMPVFNFCRLGFTRAQAQANRPCYHTCYHSCCSSNFVLLLSILYVSQAGFHKGTGTGSTALPRLTLRRVRSVGRWNHHGSSDGSSGAGSSSGGWARTAAAAAAGGDDSELTAAAQCILTAGQLACWFFVACGTCMHKPTI
jgi:hypothetical protein